MQHRRWDDAVERREWGRCAKPCMDVQITVSHCVKVLAAAVLAVALELHLCIMQCTQLSEILANERDAY